MSEWGDTDMAGSSDSRAAAELLKAFSHPTRLAILQELLDGPKCVTDMEELLPARQANISQHLAVLRHSQLVDYAQDGSLLLLPVPSANGAGHAGAGWSR